MENNINTASPVYNTNNSRHAREAAKGINRASGALCLQFVFSNVFQVVATVIIMMGMTLTGGLSRDRTELVNTMLSGRNLSLLLLLSMVPANILAVFLGFLFTKKLKGSVKGMFSRMQISKTTLLLAIPVTMGIQMLGSLFGILFENFSGSSGMESLTIPQINDDILNNICIIGYVVLLGPLSEELLMRGMALKCSNYAGGKTAYVFSAFLFGMMHGNIIQGIFAFFLGLFLAWIDIKANSIIPSVILHIWNNGLSVAMDSLDSAVGISDTAFFIYMGAAIAAGAVCFIFIRKKLSETKTPVSGFYAADMPDLSPEEKKKCGFPALFRSPCFYVFTIIYICFIIINIVGFDSLI